MVRQLSAWNKFVKTVFHSERKKNPKCTFSEALKKASQLKKAGKMKGGDLTGEDVIPTSSPMEQDSMGESSSSSSMMGGKTRKRKSKKSGRKSRKVRKSRKSKK